MTGVATMLDMEIEHSQFHLLRIVGDDGIAVFAGQIAVLT